MRGSNFIAFSRAYAHACLRSKILCAQKAQKAKGFLKYSYFAPSWPQIRLCEFKISVNFNKRDFKISGGRFVEIQKI